MTTFTFIDGPWELVTAASFTATSQHLPASTQCRCERSDCPIAAILGAWSEEACDEGDHVWTASFWQAEAAKAPCVRAMGANQDDGGHSGKTIPHLGK